MFVDQIRIQAKAGDGGSGCVSFRREKFVPKGGPDGGDGGKGGDIVLRTDIHKDNLVDFYYQPILRAKRGEHGLGKNMYGKAGADSIYKVPVGTVVYRIPPQKLEPMPTEDDRAPAPTKVRIDPADCQLIADLTEKDQEFILCRGGAGGKGNTHFKSSRNRVPRQFTEGESGEEGFLLLELRTIADAGLVGYPNAGKSTLLSRISAAHPKIAPYPFTTLEPMIGVVEYPDFSRVTVADIPGLIEGAHEGVGLGYDFLRHIERCQMLLFVIDMAGSEGRDPRDDYAQLRKEVSLYQKELGERPYLIIANKMDLPDAAENLKKFERRVRRKAIPIAGDREEGLGELKSFLKTQLAG